MFWGCMRGVDSTIFGMLHQMTNEGQCEFQSTLSLRQIVSDDTHLTLMVASYFFLQGSFWKRCVCPFPPISMNYEPCRRSPCCTSRKISSFRRTFRSMTWLSPKRAVKSSRVTHSSICWAYNRSALSCNSHYYRSVPLSLRPIYVNLVLCISSFCPFE